MTLGYRNDGTKLGFQVGSTPWNKGKKCPECGNNKRGKELTKKHRDSIGRGLKNSKIERKLKEKILYSSYHNHIRRKHGSASKCENKKCPAICKQYEWARIHERELSRNIVDYMELCISCHRLYDRHKLQITN